MLAPELLAVLACPQTHEGLIYFPRGEADRDERDGFLVCPASKLRYRIDAGVPVMLAEEAETLSGEQVQALVARARELGLPVPA